MSNINEYKDCEYLGDSVYIGNDGDSWWIFTYQGIGNTKNDICLDSHVLLNLLESLEGKIKK